MIKVGLLVRLEAKKGKEDAVVRFLNDALALANRESGTLVWFAVRFGPSSFGIFDTFAEDAARKAHLGGPIAAGLVANAADWLSQPPIIEPVDILATKLTS